VFLILFLVCLLNKDAMINEGLIDRDGANEVINIYLFLMVFAFLMFGASLPVSIFTQKAIARAGDKSELLLWAILCLFFASPISAILMLQLPKSAFSTPWGV
ncbi:MAG: hypothetical protein J5736_00880, partial [Bacilli bacterium]|nr:hypothetical protein [Bacilli bacterium]